VRELAEGLPTGAVTLLLADVEGSTELWERDSSEARSAMFDFDALVTELMAKFDGGRPLEQGEGDSFVAAFARPSDAVACALEIQRRLADGPIAVRMGLHSGEVELRDRRYDGPAIIRAARIRSLAHGGQVLLSAATRILVEDVVPGGAGFADLGSHALKGLDRPEQIFQLTHPALRTDFPPLRSGDVRRSNLPVQLTSFVGRTGELAEVRNFVETNRMVTLTGAGGCGKTRLAIEAIAPIEDSFADGVFFCDLAPLNDPAMVPQAVRVAAGLREEAERSDIDVLCDRLASAQALVVLDNCEHLIDPCVDIADALLRRCHRVHVVATTREPLGVEGEIAWRVPSLALPSDDDVAACESAQLFVERARRVRPDFVLTSDNAEHVAEICRRLDGIPLAIELAAARVRVLSVQQILEGLHDRFRLLGRGSRTVLARQQTLLASVAWSFDLLTEQQRIVLRRLSVFSGGCTFAGAENVVSGNGVEPSEVLELVSQLVDRSLLVAEENAFGTRYRMLETIRQFARDRLIDSGEAKDVSRAHLDWFAKWALDVGHAAEHGHVTTGTSMLEVFADYDNIRAAVEWALTDNMAETGLRLASALWAVIVTRQAVAGLREAEGWLVRLLEAPDIERVVRAQGLVALAWIRSFASDMPGSIAAAAEALPIVREAGDAKLIARVLVILGNANALMDPSAGLEQLAECESLAREAEDNVTLAICLFFQAQIRLFSGDAERSVQQAEQALALAQRLNITNVIAYSETILGMAAMFAGRLDDAIERLRRAEASFREARNTYWLINALQMLAFALAFRGDSTESQRLCQEAIDLSVRSGRLMGSFNARSLLARSAAERGDVDGVERLFADFGEELPGPVGRRLAVIHRVPAAYARAVAGDLPGALDVARDLSATRGAGVAFLDVQALALLAVLARAAGETKEAEDAIQEFLSMARSSSMWVVCPSGLEVAGALRADVGVDADAVRLFAAADANLTRMGAVRQPQPMFDAVAEIARIRERLDAEEFDAAWDEGSKLSLEDAIAFASRGWGPRNRPQAGWDALTPTELKVVELVAEGLSNPQIAEKLFVSPRTVSTHLSHVFAKVGVSSRAELAAQATKRTT
jgi:predicted ATPase/class 3 adenylate cyclase/DNA-binding CsgD family transcriptional regulator